ncbi:Nif11-like leader peptide family natural product precursor [Petroclostridium sp. X23]|uniref:Nif11-like leader peptide family natural product precursor n=1 Tax=Petroclostridium sp. X23 TaxID=3045146 RepID=UPI0024AD9C4D|nr:Nif11-like leader peptide family natural product precursor [Petroclostridium sp. X23]WHH58258.1 Nif11-like leader peptide family natural product precursor [Petroclostridium sp. X23]
MSKENIEKFIEELKNDPVFLDKLKEVKTKSELFAILKEAGYEFNQEELKEFTSSDQKATELSDEELNNVTGGGWLGDLMNDLYRSLMCRKLYCSSICWSCSKFDYQVGDGNSREWKYYKCNNGYFFFKEKTEIVRLDN